MELPFSEWIASENGLYVHIAVLIMLVLGGFGFPIPEDIPVILGGVAASKGIVSLHAVFLTCYCGVLFADQVIYFVGYYFGPKLLEAGTKSSFIPSITAERVEAVREGLRRRRLLYIFIGRHLFPVRTATFLSAGALRIPYLEFLLADALAALVSVTIVLWLGWFLGGTLTPEVISHLVAEGHYYLTAIIVLSVVVVLLRRHFKKMARRRVAGGGGAESVDLDRGDERSAQ